MTDNPDINGGDNAHKIAAAELRSFCERVERLEQERKERAEDINDVFGEAKSRGYDKKTMKEMLKLRALDKTELAEREALRQTYGEALGLFPGAFE
jgi:uncharacterized protein (UPF0335 family)